MKVAEGRASARSTRTLPPAGPAAGGGRSGRQGSLAEAEDAGCVAAEDRVTVLGFEEPEGLQRAL